MKKIVILGGGISGLSAAYYLKKFGNNKFEIILLEKENRVGGWVHSVDKEGFLFEEGPRTFRLDKKGKITFELISELGLDCVKANVDKKFLYLEGKLRPVNLGLFLKEGGLKAFFREFFIPPSEKEDESIGEFFTRRFGRDFAETFIDPMVRGIFGGDLFSLSIRSCLPFFYELDKKGPLSKAFLSKRKQVPFFSLKEGMESLPKALQSHLGSSILLGQEVKELVFNGKQYEITTQKGCFKADYVISALPAHSVGKIMRGLDFLNEIPFISLTTIGMAFHKPCFHKKGFGYLVPSKEKEKILGMTWDSAIFSDNRRASFCIMLPGDKNEKEALEIAKEALRRHLGIYNEPDVIHHQIAKKAIPQYSVGHHELLKKLELPQMSFLGNSFFGVGVNDCVFEAQKLATKLVNQ